MEKVVALSCVFGLGMCFSLLGSVSIKLMPRLKIDQGKFGSLISVFMFTCLIVSLIMGVVTDSLGYKPVAIFGFVITGMCIFMLASGKMYGMTLVACLLLGFGAMALNTAGNTMIPRVLFGGQNEPRPVKYWQVDNEPPRGREGYADLVRVTSEAIKRADPGAKVLIGGLMQLPYGRRGVQAYEQAFLPILRELEGTNIDVFDMHWFGRIGEWKVFPEVVQRVRQDLQTCGFREMPIFRDLT